MAEASNNFSIRGGMAGSGWGPTRQSNDTSIKHTHPTSPLSVKHFNPVVENYPLDVPLPNPNHMSHHPSMSLHLSNDLGVGRTSKENPWNSKKKSSPLNSQSNPPQPMLVSSVIPKDTPPPILAGSDVDANHLALMIRVQEALS